MVLKPMEIIVPSTQKIFIKKLTEIIENNIEDEEFTVENLCKDIGMSRTQVHRKIKAITNESNYPAQTGYDVRLIYTDSTKLKAFFKAAFG